MENLCWQLIFKNGWFPFGSVKFEIWATFFLQKRQYNICIVSELSGPFLSCSTACFYNLAISRRLRHCMCRFYGILFILVHAYTWRNLMTYLTDTSYYKYLYMFEPNPSSRRSQDLETSGFRAPSCPGCFRSRAHSYSGHSRSWALRI